MTDVSGNWKYLKDICENGKVYSRQQIHFVVFHSIGDYHFDFIPKDLCPSICKEVLHKWNEYSDNLLSNYINMSQKPQDGMVTNSMMLFEFWKSFENKFLGKMMLKSST